MMFNRFIFGGLAVAAIVAPLSAYAANCTAPNSIVKVSNSKSGPWEFVDFYVKAPLTATTSVTAPTGPNFTEDASGNPIFVPGNRWTEVTFNAVDWMCSAPTQFSLPKPIVKSIKQTGRFEGTVSYVIGRNGRHFMGSSGATIGGLKRLRLKYF
jgi:hypothetical protein